MAQCNTQDLMTEANCFACFGHGDGSMVEMALLCRILKALNPVATCNVNSLLSEAQCFLCLSPQQWELVKLQLLCNISSAITGGAMSSMSCGPADPVPAPTDPTKCSMYANTTTNSLWFWNNATASWVPLII